MGRYNWYEQKQSFKQQQLTTNKHSIFGERGIEEKKLPLEFFFDNLEFIYLKF